MGDFWTTYLSSAEKMANVTLVTRNRQQQATHAVLLASVSPLMKVMLMEVQVTGESTTIILPDFTREEVELCLDSLFRGSRDHLGRSLLDTLGVHPKEAKNETSKEEVIDNPDLNFRLKCEPVTDDDEYKNDDDDYKDDDDWFEETRPPSTPNKFPCSYCEKQFTTQKRMKCHMSLTHENDGLGKYESNAAETSTVCAFQCQYCPKKYQTQQNLTCHISRNHEEMSDYYHHVEFTDDKWVCLDCRKTFEKRHLCVLHWRQAHKTDKPMFSCDICQKKFKKKGNLKEHKNVHNRTKEFVCDLCGKSFNDKKILKLHHIKIHGTEEEKKANQKHVCSTCGKAFYKKVDLDDHENIHTGVKSFRCDQCDFGAFTPSGLRTHIMRIHQGLLVPTPEQRAKQNVQHMLKREERRKRNGGSIRTPEEKVKFNAYMRKWMANKKRQKFDENGFQEEGNNSQ